jgi:hypothetical protein
MRAAIGRSPYHPGFTFGSVFRFHISVFMNHTQPKFILTKDSTLRLGMVKRHLELIRAGEVCIGGGYYQPDTISHRLLLSGASSEYGEPAWDKVDRIRISAYYQGFEITYSSWDSWKEEFPVSERLEVIYQ